MIWLRYTSKAAEAKEALRPGCGKHLGALSRDSLSFLIGPDSGVSSVTCLSRLTIVHVAKAQAPCPSLSYQLSFAELIVGRISLEACLDREQMIGYGLLGPSLRSYEGMVHDS